MRVRAPIILLLVAGTLAFWVPMSAHASVVWSSAATHPDEVRIYTPDLINTWYDGTSASTSIKIGIWDQPDFTTTASTSVHIWTRWNGVSGAALDIILLASSGGDPISLYGLGSTTARLVDLPYGFYPLGVDDATSTLREYTVPMNRGSTVHSGNEMWAWFYPSGAWYGSNHWLGSNGSVPYVEICEGSCTDNDSPPPDPCASGGCVSNVLFLPGIEASRLYYRGALGIEHQVWEPDYRTDIPYLAMNSDGTSKYPLYTKDIVDTVQAHNPLIGTIADIFGSNLETYGGFARFMDALVASSTVKEWKAYPYDWRYDVRDIVENGTPTEMSDGSIRQIYLADVLRDMASSSPTKKVTIVAHSNGGLLAKALAIKLGADVPNYIDRIIMIGTPQWGTPSDIGVMLHGDGQTNGLGLITNSSDVRAAAETMPSTYGLLPSSAYFAHIADAVVTFDATGLLSGKYAASFGEALTSFSALANFLTDAAGLNAQAGNSSDLRTPLTLSSALVDKAAATHSVLDNWTPPPGITVTSIAGWGQDTVKTLAYATKQRISCSTSASTFLCTETPYLEHAPVTTQDGDSTVVSPSAIGNIDNGLYFNAKEFDNQHLGKIIHQNLSSASPIQNVIEKLLKNTTPITDDFIKTTLPTGGINPIILRISSHSPVNVVITDADGNQSGVLPIPGTDFSGVKRDIPGSSVQVFDDEEYVSVPMDGAYQVLASGYAAGSATINVETVNGDTASITATFTSVPTTASSTLAFSVTSGTPTAPTVDVNGDGTADFSAVSSSAGSDPLAYVRYMRAAVGAFSLPKNKNQLDQKLGEVERQLASMKKGGAKSNLHLLTTLAHYVEQQITLKNPEKGIPVAHAESILGMINTLKSLLI